MNSKNNWIKYSNYGFQIIATLLFFGGIGYYIDTVVPNKAPLFFVLSLLVGVFVGLYHLWVSIFK
tara:strand:- start:501 stop:695 length:195 start_codon:yes stop_codon:yes gene_type:complete